MTDVTKNGLRIHGDENTPNAERHRSFYRWAAARLKEHGAAPWILDFGCGAGYGSSILMVEVGVPVRGYDPDPDAIAFAREHHGLPAYSTDLEATLAPAAGSPGAAVAIEVIEHLSAPPRETIERLLTYALLVVGSVPYNEREGGNSHHLHFGITEETLAGLGAEVWTAPLDGSIVLGVCPGAMNMLFVVRR